MTEQEIKEAKDRIGQLAAAQSRSTSSADALRRALQDFVDCYDVNVCGWKNNSLHHAHNRAKALLAREETDEAFEDRLLRQEAGENLRLLDYIADKIGLPHNEELSRDSFDQWMGIRPHAQGLPDRDVLAAIIAPHFSRSAFDAVGGWLDNDARCKALDAADQILTTQRPAQSLPAGDKGEAVAWFGCAVAQAVMNSQECGFGDRDEAGNYRKMFCDDESLSPKERSNECHCRKTVEAVVALAPQPASNAGGEKAIALLRWGTWEMTPAARLDWKKRAEAFLADQSGDVAYSAWKPDLEAATNAVRDEIGSRLCHLTPHGTRICSRQVSSVCLCEETARAALCSQAPTPSVPSTEGDGGATCTS